MEKKRSSLRQKVLTFVGAFILLSVLGSTLSLYRITEVNRLVDTINRVSIPLGRLFTQMQSDADIFQHELERGLGFKNWKDPKWNPKPIPRWIQDVLESEMERVRTLVKTQADWASGEDQSKWTEWANGISADLTSLRAEAGLLYSALEQKDMAKASQIYPHWTTSVDEWRRRLQWGASEYERSLRMTFSLAETRVSELRTGLELILVTVILLSLLLLWLGERALRPLGELTSLAREITRRGLRKEDKSLLPEIPLTREDEVSQLAREFHRMATALLEREKMVESQKNRLQEQNRLLRDMGELNQNILNSIKSVLIVTNLEGKITQCNPSAAEWLGAAENEIIGTELRSWKQVPELPSGNPESQRIEPYSALGRIFGGHWMALKQHEQSASGAILVLEDLTDEVDLQERLRSAENLAAVGRLSAQVAHEVRNPLHSIGLEAEMAVEMAGRTGDPALKQSLQSILSSVDRLEKITENYLKLSRLSSGAKKIVDLGETLEAVLATYTPMCEQSQVQVDWMREDRANLRVIGDPDLLEQVLGNLFRNALQALESRASGRKISWWMGNTEEGRVWLKIQDNGPGISPEIRAKLFTPFVTTRAQGTGLGLSFVKKVLNDHGGEIRFEETAVGASFVIVLPGEARAAAHSGQVPDSTPDSTPGSTKEEQIHG